MKLKDRLIGAFFGNLIESKVSERLKAASFLDSPSVEDMKWRRLTGNANRELIPTTQDRMIEIAYWLWETNPLAGWLIDITTAFIMADGLPYESEDDDVKEVLDGFWNDPVNRMSLYFSKHVSELHIFGELCMPAFVASQTGRVRLGYIDPAQIQAVVTDPENVKMQIGVLTKGWIGEIAGYGIEQKPKKYKTILPEEADYVLSPEAQALRNQFTDGECFYFGINNVTNSPRGRSSLLGVSDWLDAYEQYLFDYADRWPMLNTFVWDLLVQGGDATSIKEQVANFTKKSGSVYGHNEKVTLTPAAPDIKAIQAQDGARMFRNHILGRFGYPEHWYGGGGDVNRATAAEMDLPAFKINKEKQNYIKFMLEEMLGYQIRQARRANFLKGSNGDFSVITPQMQSKDVTKYSTAFGQVISGLAQAEMREWVDKDTSRKIFSVLADFLGVEVDPETMKQAVEKERDTESIKDYLGTEPQTKLKEAMRRVK